MPIQIGRPPEHGFDEPLGLLSDCHRRIERFLGAMLIIVKRSGGAGLSPSDRGVLEQCRHYFATAGPRHTADEEESLFPRLRGSESPRAHEALATLETLESDHRDAEARHARVDEAVQRWAKEGTLPADSTRQLLADLEELQAIYTRHIKVEDQELFPAAAAALGADDLRSIGQEMADRRGVPFRKDLP
jgi:hemerythrin-like domain-containing protein